MSTFTFLNHSWDPDTGQLSLHYRDSVYGYFCEQFWFERPQGPLSEAQSQALVVAFDLLFWMAGISYYKTQLAKNIEFTGTQPSDKQAEWLQTTWQAGLAELAHQNDLPWLDWIQFAGGAERGTAHELGLQPRSLVAIGGGKDSLVSIDYLEKQGEDVTLFMVGNSEFIQQVASVTSSPLAQVKRRVDPRLKQANQAGAYNGHVPITAINGCVAVCQAIMHDHDAVVFSNERSANVGNVTMESGQEANHQYSKSLAYEQAFQSVIHSSVAKDLHCFSLLRPFSEVAIVKRFARLPQYFPHFSSCNRNFHLAGSQNQQGHWCRKCPKCAFVFLTLAMCLDKATVLSVFGGDLLADESLADLYAELLGVQGNKPFECVGEIAESRLAFESIMDHPDWSEGVLVKRFKGAWHEMTASEKHHIMHASDQHLIPDLRSFLGIVNEID